MSRYIYLDAEIGGTGLYDLDGTEIDPQSLPLSSETRSLLSTWLENYWENHLDSSSSTIIKQLDKTGLALKRVIQGEIQSKDVDCLILYWSEGQGVFLNDNGIPIFDEHP